MNKQLPPYGAFKHGTPIEIRYGDIDMLQHVNNAAYLTYLEQARIGYAKDVLGWDGKMNTLNMILAKATVDFKLPLYLHDSLVIYTRCSRIGNRSWEFEYVFLQTTNGEPVVAALASTVMVAFDVVTQRSTNLSDEFKQIVRNFEGDLLSA